MVLGLLGMKLNKLQTQGLIQMIANLVPHNLILVKILKIQINLHRDLQSKTPMILTMEIKI